MARLQCYYIASNLCPRNFCNRNESYFLPDNLSALDGVICGTERTGLLCGKCRENYSAFYHSQDLKCTHNSRCKRTIGWLFYIMSEICPVTVLFLTVIVWDIQLTTGSIQGFILYSQLFDTLHIYADGKIYLNDETSNSLFVLKLFLNVFNLNFLIHDRLSFCLWENASSLDVLAFKYVTIAYAFSLVIITVLVLNYCKFEECLKKIRRTKLCTPRLVRISGDLLLPVH